MFLVVPGERFRPPPRLDDPDLRAAYDQGVRDAAARSSREKPSILSAEELDRLATLGREARRAYLLAARREPVRAPPPLALDAALLALEGFAIVWAAGVRGLARTIVRVPPLLALTAFTTGARKRIERRRARDLGLSITTAPQRIVGGAHLALLLAVVPCRLYHRHRDSSARDDWPLMLARTLIGHFVARQSWHRAMRAAS
ncbi:MAG TPA: hypothetical protein VF257_02930 [Solirubrobacteraceae bacterium]